MKKFLISCLVVAYLLALSSCNIKETEGTTDTESLQQEIANLQQQIAELEEENKILRGETTSSGSDNTAPNTPAEPSTTTVELNKTFSVGEVMDITLADFEWCDTVLPSKRNGFYSYYEDKEGETYFLLRGTIKSYASDSFELQWSTDSSILVNGKYSFYASMEFEDGDGGGFGESIKPLQTRNFILKASVSDEVVDIGESVQVNFSIPDNEEELSYFYDDSHSNADFSITFTNVK